MAKSAKEVWESLEPEIDWSKDPAFVSYRQIKDVGGEPRLAAKFDQRERLPGVLKKHGRFIMPAPGGYNLHKGTAYYDFSAAPAVRNLPAEVPDLYTFGPGTAEHMHLRYALRQGVFHDFLNTEESLTESWSGRRFINAIKYKFGGAAEHELKGVQIEIDLGLALDHSEIVLVEGKAALFEDFNARQLFLPYLDAKSRLPGTLVTPMFFEVHETGIYTLRSFTFAGNDITSLKEVQAIRYHLDFDREIAIPPFTFSSTSDIPQADKPDLIMDAVEAIRLGASSKADIAKKLNGGNYDPRQGDYYAHAARILGLVHKDGSSWGLTEEGKRYSAKTPDDKRRDLARRITNMEAVQLHRSQGRQAVLDFFLEGGFNESTAKRRAQTISSWCRWIDAY